jgi:hypothetical protein
MLRINNEARFLDYGLHLYAGAELEPSVGIGTPVDGFPSFGSRKLSGSFRLADNTKAGGMRPFKRKLL